MILLENVCKKYKEKEILNNINLKIEDGSFTFITGKSGSGKTTLLNIISLLEKPTSGKVFIDNYENISKKDLIEIRRNLFGYLFQNYGLIENETVEKNIKIALKFNKKNDKEIKNILEMLGLTDIINKKIYMLSGGEQQRVALARIILKPCKYIFADEPTGNLDEVNRNLVYEILNGLNKKGKTILFVTHDKELLNFRHNIINL
nr:ABC transporter ATP-binding protein [uncultured Tyzzerella sp.]